MDLSAPRVEQQDKEVHRLAETGSKTRLWN